jgi:omega-amidase
MKVVLVQNELIWENPEANVAAFDALIRSITGTVDLIVLPEMFTTGFSMRPEYFATASYSAGLPAMQAWAKSTGAAIAASMMTPENGKFYNRMHWVYPDGSMKIYDKRHLFSIGTENEHYTAGQTAEVIEWKNWRFLPCICYDLRFPVWLRRTTQRDYDVLLVVANWPERRAAHWNALLVARAIENQVYVVAVNRTGTDANGINHSGHSVVINPKGEVMTTSTNLHDMLTTELQYTYITEWRTQFPAINDADSFAIM